MENKKLGMIMIGISIVFLLFLLFSSFDLYESAKELGCNPSEECKRVESVLSITHGGFGFFGFMIALGVYLLVFNKTDETNKEVMKRLEKEKDKKLAEEKFDLILKGLDDHEKKVMKSIKEQQGITQSTLRIRTNLSKTKLSYVLSGLEEKGLINKKEKGRKNNIYLRI